MKLIKILTLVSLILAPGLSHAKGETSGGGLPEKIDVAVIESLLFDGSLKRAMINYLNTIQINKIAIPKIQQMFKDFSHDNLLIRDIETRDNYYTRSGCRDDYEVKANKQDSLKNDDDLIAAKAFIGDFGGKICFDSHALAKMYNSLSVEEAMIRLAALALHEHVHHLQKETDPIEKNEKEAYELAAYVRLTARIANLPTLKWQPNTAQVESCKPIKGKYIFESADYTVTDGLYPEDALPKEYFISNRSRRHMFVSDGTKIEHYEAPPLNEFIMDNNPHLIEHIKRPNPNNNYFYEYTAYCTSNGFVISYFNSDHNGYEPKYTKAGYSQRTYKFSFSENKLNLAQEIVSFDTNKNVISKQTIHSVYRQSNE